MGRLLLSPREHLFTRSGNVALQSIRSARRVQQGDPLGPVLFTLAVHPAIAEARAATEASHPGGIDICSFFLDDGFCAGSARAVQCFLTALVEGFRRVGLTVNFDKTEVIPACSLAQSFCPADFQGCSWNGTSNFKLLGAPVGSDAWCEELLGRRVGKARALLSAIGRFPDAQGAFSLLRSCSGWSKVLYSCRTVPPDAQFRGLRTADSDLRAALGQLIGRPLSEDDWRLASLGVAAGGLGARCAAEHAPAAYVASVSACRELCGHLWPAFDPFDLDEGCRLAAAEEALRGIYAVSDSPSQKSLSGMVEARSVSGIFGDPTLPRHRRLHLEACRVPGAGAWLTANPSCVDSHVSSLLFRVALQRRLRMPLWDRDTACVGRFSTAGVITPLPVAVVGIGFCATTRSAMWSAPRSLSSLRSRLSLRSLASSSPRGLPILGVTTPMSTPPLFLPHSLPLVAALPIFGFPGASLASLRPGTSRFPRCFAPLTSLLPLPLLPMSSTKWKPGNAPSRTWLLLWPSAGPPSARLRLVGAGGLKPSGASWLGLPLSPAWPAA